MIPAINKTVKALSHTPQYKMHKYFARRPYNVFSNLIEYYSKKGQTVLDVFCGGGVTVFEGVKLERNVIGVDLNPLATFITKMQMFNDNLEELNEYIQKFIDNNINQLKSLYEITIRGDRGVCEWIEWAYKVKCPKCGADIILKETNKIKNGIYGCPKSTCEYNSGVARTKCHPNGAIPVRVKYQSYLDKSIKTVVLSEEEASIILNQENNYFNKADKYVYPKFDFPMNWDRQKEDKLFEKGIIKYRDLFSNRNLFILSYIFDAILKEKKVNSKYADYLYFIFSSSLRYTNKMSKVTENWEGGNPTCMDKHAYYLPNSFIENNVVDVFKERASIVLRGCKYSQEELPTRSRESTVDEFSNETANFCILNCSSDSLPLKNESVDVIITDPPYGSNVQYAELSVVWNAWYQIYAEMDNYIYRDQEAVSNRKGNYAGAKTEFDYERMLNRIFKESYRVLKNNSYMVFTFNNKNLNVWLAMLRAVAKSGFYLAENGVLFQDFISSYKNTSHLKYEGNVQGDFIYTFVKTTDHIIYDFKDKTIESVIEDSINDVIESIFDSDICISSEHLYKEVFIRISSNLMKLIIYCQSIGSNIDDMIFKESSIDSYLEKKLIYNENGWKKRN